MNIGPKDSCKRSKRRDKIKLRNHMNLHVNALAGSRVPPQISQICDGNTFQRNGGMENPRHAALAMVENIEEGADTCFERYC